MPSTLELRQRIDAAREIGSLHLEDLVGIDPPAPPKRNRSGGSGDDDERSLLRFELEFTERFVEMHQKDLRYSPELKTWYCWTGKVWEPDVAGRVYELAKRTTLQLTKEYLRQAKEVSSKLDQYLSEEGASKKDDEAKALLSQIRTLNKRCDQVQSKQRIDNMIALARSDVRVGIERKQLDADRWALNCQNGIVDLRTGRIRPHKREEYCTRITPVAYDRSARCEALEQLLHATTGGDEQMQTFLQQALGNSVFGHNDLEKVYMAYGPGGTGKGTLFEAVKSATGAYTLTAEFQSFVKVQGHRVRDDLARLHDCHLVLASEIEKGEVLAAAVVKQISGNDTISARHLFKEYFEFRPRLTLWLQANDLPRVDDQDSGIWRRMVVVPFPYQIPEHRRDPRIKRQLLDPEVGGPAVLAWLVTGAVATHDVQRIVPPEPVRQSTSHYHDSMDPTLELFEEVLRFAADGDFDLTWCPQTTLTQSCAKYLRDSSGNARYQLSARSLTKRLQALGRSNGHIRRINGRAVKCWRGVTLADPTEDCEDSFLPSREIHLQVLAAARGETSPVASALPSGFSEADDRAALRSSETSATSDQARSTREGSPKRGTRAEKMPEPGASHRGAAPTDQVARVSGDDWPDLDDLGPLPPLDEGLDGAPEPF